MISIVLLIAIVSAQTCEHANNTAQISRNNNNQWDFLLYVLTWAGNFCYGSNCCDLPTSTMSIRPGFTIHGWWPNYYSGYPQFCQYPEGLTFDKITEQIMNDQELKEDIAYYWPSERKCKFFEYEYDKHGTCARDVYDGENAAKDYAKAAINFLRNMISGNC